MKRRRYVGEPDNRKMLIFKVDRSLHTDIKSMAARHNISMNLLIVRALYKYIAQEVERVSKC